LKISTKAPDLSVWKGIVNAVYRSKKEVTIALIGKYVGIKDSYKSLYESLVHGGIPNEVRVHIEWIDSEQIEESSMEPLLKKYHGILVAGGFGSRGIEGKISAIRYAREKKVPFFGICLGLQCAIIESARNMAGLKEASSTEFNPKTKFPLIDLMAEQRGSSEKGGTMRLGTYPCQIEKGTVAYKAYKKKEVFERHRHRYEVNNIYRAALRDAGIVFSGVSPDQNLVEMVERKDHPWFLAVQFHPEFHSRPNCPHPLFQAFLRAAADFKPLG
jgi:CTP synthase